MIGRKSFTMTLDFHLMREAKKRAIDLGIPLYQFVEDAVREVLADDSEDSLGSQGIESYKTSEQDDLVGRQS